MSKLRLIPASTGWWALSDSRAARLPEYGVRPSAATPEDPTGYDPERQLRLTVEAQAALSAAGFFTSKPNDNYAVTVLTATACNLGCNYCFQNLALAPEGSHAPPRIKSATLDTGLVAATVRFIARQMRAAQLSSTSVLLFGGEPLLNFPGCVRLLTGLSELNLRDAEIVTNGVLLTPERAAGLYAAGLRRVQITFDGDRETHDRVRVTRNGRPTYGDIIGNVRAAAEACPDLAWNFRVNVSHHNVDHLHGLVADLAEVTGKARQVTLHLALIDDTGLGYENEVGYDKELAETFVAVNRAAICAGMRVPPSKPLTACPYCSVSGGSQGAVVNADGALYSCWENAGRDGWPIGHVDTGYADQGTVTDRWVACDFDIEAHGSPTATRQFLDRVDAAALDDQHDQHLLERPPASTRT